MDQIPATRVMHIDNGDCADNKICPAVVEVDGLDGYLGLIGKEVADPAIAAALAPHTGPGEVAVVIPTALYDMIKRTADDAARHR